MAATPPIPGAVTSFSSGFVSETGWQHVCDYQCALGIADDLVPVSIDCATDPPRACPTGR